MYLAVAVENLCQGMATGAFGVMLLRMTQKQFSATQYAVFSSIFALGRTVTGPIAGFSADALGWTPFFFMSTVASIPGLLLLQRFAPIGGLEPKLDELERMEARPVSRQKLAVVSAASALAGFAVALAVSALLSALKVYRLDPAAGVHYAAALSRILAPLAPADWAKLSGLVVVGLVSGVGAWAYLAARHGLRRA